MILKKKKGVNMFKVKRKGTDKVYQVLDTSVEDVFGLTYFLIWENGGWRWRPAKNFVPPNWKEEEGTK